jgi:lysophospholipase L1-like esterase
VDRSKVGVGPVTLYTFGDSILDCGWYNELGINVGQLLVKNHEALFPEFRGQDLSTHYEARLMHRAVDGATVTDLPRQARRIDGNGRAIAILTIGGNDILQALRNPRALATFEDDLARFVGTLPIRPVLLGNVYDPSLGDDANNFLGVPVAPVRAMHARTNASIASVAQQYGQLVDLHAHFLTGDPTWFTRTIEPSLRGASEVRRCFLPVVLDALTTARR